MNYDNGRMSQSDSDHFDFINNQNSLDYRQKKINNLICMVEEYKIIVDNLKKQKVLEQGFMAVKVDDLQRWSDILDQNQGTYTMENEINKYLTEKK